MKAPTDALKIKTNVRVYRLINGWVEFCSLRRSLRIELNDMSVNKTFLYFRVSKCPPEGARRPSGAERLPCLVVLVFFPLQILKYFSDRKTTRKQKCQLTELFISFLYIN